MLKVIDCDYHRIFSKGDLMNRFILKRRSTMIGLLLLTALLLILWSYPVVAGSHANTARQVRHQAFNPQTLRNRIASHSLASTVQVLTSQSPSVIIQFPLFPSGVKAKFPDAKGVVTIVQGNPEASLFDTVTVDVENMPPDT